MISIATIAVLQLVYSEAMSLSGFFLKKKPPCIELKMPHSNWGTALAGLPKIPQRVAVDDGIFQIVEIAVAGFAHRGRQVVALGVGGEGAVLHVFRSEERRVG